MKIIPLGGTNNMKSKLLMSALAMVSVLAIAVTACQSDEGPTDADLQNAEATASAAQSALGDANSRADAAEAAKDAAERAAADLQEIIDEMGSMEDTGSRLAQVQDRGKVICASRNDVPGYGSLDDSGRNVGFDIDLCRAVAAAVLGDPEAIEIQFITAAERGPTIQSGEVDVLVRTVTWTTSRDAQWGNYAQTMFYDGQGFMVPADLGVTSAYELGGAAVCVTSGTTTELNMADFFRQNNMEYNPQVFEDTDIVLSSYESGACDVFTNDRSQLAALRTSLQDPDSHVILPETISEEPLGPVVPHGDDQWFDIVKTVMSGLIYAEGYGINSENVSAKAGGDDVKAKRLLGTEGTIGQESLGLSETFMQDVINAVGNYGEIYDRNLGPDGIDLPREGGRNALWSDASCSDCPKGGQIYAAPLR
jgi:general L-amino acid transport system substrate-binding protein